MQNFLKDGGINFCNRFGMRTGDQPLALPTGLVYRPEHVDGAIHDLRCIQTHVPVKKLRTILFWADLPGSGTRWLELPPSQQQTFSIQDFAWRAAIPIEFVWGALWLARWVQQDGHGPIPPNAFTNPQKEFEAHKAAFERVVSPVIPLPDGRFKCGLPEETEWDGFNEMDMNDLPDDPFDYEQPLMELLFPWMRAYCRKLGFKYTMSTIWDGDESAQRSMDAYDYIQGLWKSNAMLQGLDPAVVPFLDFLEIHINGVPDELVEKNLHQAMANLRGTFGLDVTIGEDDMERGWSAMQAIATVAPRDYFRWIVA